MTLHCTKKVVQIMVFSILLILLVLGNGVSGEEKVPLLVSTNDLTFEVPCKGKFSVWLSEPLNYSVPVLFNYTVGRSINNLPENLTIEANSNDVLNFTATAFKAGHTTVVAYSNVSGISFSTSFVRISVFKVSWLNVFSSVVGWLYFVCWSVSFYPQIYQNYMRKSVVGLNFDFLGLNLTGFIAYSIFNIGLRYVNEVKNEYHQLNPTGVIPVEVNDVVFAVHAAFATIVTIGQCFIYERGDQLIARTTVAILSLVWSTAGVFLLVTALDINKFVPWLTYLYFFSYVKLLVTLTKYIPQVVYNYKRKSTVGWSIGTVLLDFIGGMFSIMQMFIIAYNFNDWRSIFGNLTKFGLGVISITFDVIFMTQHYCLYPKKKSDMHAQLLPEA